MPPKDRALLNTSKGNLPSKNSQIPNELENHLAELESQIHDLKENLRKETRLREDAEQSARKWKEWCREYSKALTNAQLAYEAKLRKLGQRQAAQIERALLKVSGHVSEDREDESDSKEEE